MSKFTESPEVIMKTKWGNFIAVAFESGNRECIRLVSPKKMSPAPLTRLHSSCLTSEILGDLNCDCCQQLHEAANRISKEGGVLIYSYGEGRGAGIVAKLTALSMKDKLDINSFDAYRKMGNEADPRDYSLEAAAILKLGIESVNLLTNNKLKVDGLMSYGIKVTRVPFTSEVTPENSAYLRSQQHEKHYFS